MQTTVLSLGGSIIVPNKINTNFLKKFRALILNYIKKNRVIIVCGGGKTCRNYINAANTITKTKDVDNDWVGIKATMLNAELVRAIFDSKALLIGDPEKKIKTKKRIIIGSGWVPGHSSDLDAVQLAKNFKAKTLINLSNISYAYTKDPKKYKDAKKITKTTWNSFQKIVGNKWKPGLNSPFDPIASKKAKQLKLKVIIAKGTDIKNLKNILNNKRYKGTTIE